MFRTCLAVLFASTFLPAIVQAAPAAASQPIWCLPEYYRIDPAARTIAETGFKPIDPAMKLSNDIYSAADNAVKLVALKGQTAAFQIVVEENLSDVTLAAKGLGEVAFYYEGYLHAWDADAKALRTVPELAVPLAWLDNHFDVVQTPAALPVVPGKTLQAIWVDIIVPRKAKTGPLAGSITVSAGGKPLSTIAVTIDVADLALPPQPAYNLALIQYGFGGKNPRVERDLYVQVQAHRATIHDVPYSSQRGWGEEGVVPVTTLSPVFRDLDKIRTKAVADWKKGQYELLPELAFLTDRKNHSTAIATGAEADWKYRLNDTLPAHDAILRQCREAYRKNGAGITDWTEFDRRYGPLFDGSAFADGQPLESFELPFNFNWPAPLDTFRKDDPRQSEMYEAIWMAVARDFVKHAGEKGWTRTQFFVYFNPKDRDNNLSMWKGDEPCEKRDFLAHAYFSDLTRRAFAKPGKVKVAYKIELGHYECDFVHCAKAKGKDKEWDEAKAAEMLKPISHWSVSRHYHAARERIAQRIRNEGDVYYRYGSPTRYSESAMGLYGIAPLAIDDLSSGYFFYAPGRPNMTVFKSHPGEKIRDVKVDQHSLHYDASIFGKPDKALLSLRFKAVRAVEAHVAAFQAAVKKDPAFARKISRHMVKYVAKASGSEAGMDLPFVNNNPADMYTAWLEAVSIATGKDYLGSRTYKGPIPGVEARSDAFHYCINCGEACSETKCQWCGADQTPGNK
jgi:hypothetical protein